MEKAELLPEVRLTSSVGKRPVLTVDEVLRLPLDEEIIVLRGQNILKLKKYKFHNHPDFAAVKASEPITISNYTPDISYKYEHTEKQKVFTPQFLPEGIPEVIPYATAPEKKESEKPKRPRRKSTGLKIN